MHGKKTEISFMCGALNRKLDKQPTTVGQHFLPLVVVDLSFNISLNAVRRKVQVLHHFVSTDFILANKANGTESRGITLALNLNLK